MNSANTALGLFLVCSAGLFGCGSSDSSPADPITPGDDAGYDGGNRPPEAHDMSVSVRLNTPRTIQLAATDPDGNPLTYRIVETTWSGTLEGSGNTYTYTPEADRLGPDSFTFTVDDGTTDAEYPAYVWITVNEADANESPQVNDAILWTEPGKDLAIALDAWDLDGDSLSYVVTTQPEHGTLTGSGSRLTYSPAAGFVGSDLLRYTVDDGKGPIEGIVTICVAPRPTSRDVSPDERAAAIAQISEKRKQLGALSSPSELRQLEEFVRSLPVVAFVASNLSGVFGQYADGVQFIVLADPIMGQEPPAPPPPAFPMNAVLPTGKGAVLLSGFGPSNYFPKDPTGELATWLTNKGYQVDQRGGSVEDFKIASQPALVHVRTHGGWGAHLDGSGEKLGASNSWWTTTKYDPKNAAYEKDVKAGLLVLMDQEVSAGVTETHYGVTAKFIANHWKLGEGAQVHASSCWLGRRPEYDPSSGKPFVPSNTDLQDAVFGAGAQLFAGWTRATEVAVLDRVSRFVVDRMLGSNLQTPFESPPQRPMGAASIMKDMMARGLDLNKVEHYGNTWTSAFQFVTPMSAGGRYRVDRLAPSITQLLVDTDKNELWVYGDFESYMASNGLDDYRVSIDGMEYPVTRRESDAFVCDFPFDGSGDVVVLTQGRKSNRTRLSRWTVDMTYSIIGPGSLKQEFTYKVKLVGDVHQYRDEAGKAPKTHKSYLSMIQMDSAGNYAASGEHADAKYRVVWSNSGQIKPHTAQSSCEGCFTFFAQTTPDTPKKLWWNIFVGMKDTGIKEQIYAWDENKKTWALNNDRTIPIMFPLDNAGMADTSDYDTGMFALKLPADIEEDGTLKGGSTGLEVNKLVGAGNFTGWEFKHELKWETAMPEGDSGIDPEMPR